MAAAACEPGEILLFIDSSEGAVDRTDIQAIETLRQELLDNLGAELKITLFTFDHVVADGRLVESSDNIIDLTKHRLNTGISTSLLRVLRRIATHHSNDCPLSQRTAPHLAIVVSDFLDEPARDDGWLANALRTERDSPGLDLPISAIRDNTLKVLLLKTFNPTGNASREALEEFRNATEADLKAITDLGETLTQKLIRFLACPLTIEIRRAGPDLTIVHHNPSNYARELEQVVYECQGIRKTLDYSIELQPQESQERPLLLDAEAFEACHRGGMTLKLRLKTGPTTIHLVPASEFVQYRFEPYALYDALNENLSLGLFLSRRPPQSSIPIAIELNERLARRQKLTFDNSTSGPLRCEIVIPVERHEYHQLLARGPLPIEASRIEPESESSPQTSELLTNGEIQIGTRNDVRPSRFFMKVLLLCLLIFMLPAPIRIVEAMTTTEFVADSYDDLFASSSLAAALQFSLHWFYRTLPIEQAAGLSFLLGGAAVLSIAVWRDRNREPHDRAFFAEARESVLERNVQKADQCKLRLRILRRSLLSAALVLFAFLVYSTSKATFFAPESPGQNSSTRSCVSIDH